VEAVRRRPEWRKIPILVLTAKALSEAESGRLHASVNRVLRKGALRRKDLLGEVADAVRESVRLRRHAGADG
ncbi:MAG: hypothetical protein ACYTG6_09510, partial [Planctomycetota bacterium]